ncbi:DNA mismatch repair protein MutS-like [Ylistrum balloti]|uniref:DNA mismatch repair protein MutS-like n=1 Tax=Ylistrum balloti TaxID=509963 RepID=UPI00290598D8|nr:DNA mismatch repair protein MutS-like [Ylistrum balloti]
MKVLTPMMRQYFEIKNQHPDKYIFFRLGDFYEIFSEEAVEVSKILNITLTKRNNIYMCGFPHQQLHHYTQKVISKGKKIVIVEQMEKPEDSSQKLVERKVSQIITPGTTLDDFNLLEKEKNFIIHLSFNEAALNLLVSTHSYFLVALDISTGETIFVSLQDKQDLENEIDRFFENYSPKEVILFKEDETGGSQESFYNIEKIKNNYPNAIINYLDKPDHATITNRLNRVFSKTPLDSQDSQENDSSSSPLSNFWSDPQYPDYPLAQGLCLLLNYAESNQNEIITYLQKPKWISKKNYMALDFQTLVHLEIFKNNLDHTSKYSLISVIDYTLTSMGARKLQESIALPSLNAELINYRLDQTEYLYLHPHTLKEIRSQLKNISDLERIGSRIVLKKVLPREFISLKQSLRCIHQLFSLVLGKNPNLLVSSLNHNIQLFEKMMPVLLQLIKRIDDCLVSSPGNDFQKGGIVKPDIDPKLSEYFLIKKNSEELLSQLEAKERQKSTITNLKIKYNGNLGFFFETRKHNLKNIPEYFIPKQSLVNCERFTTKELIKLEGKIIEATEKSCALEKEIFMGLRDEIAKQVGLFQSIASSIADIDLIASFAELAVTKNYVKPQVINEGMLCIKGGRHPVIEEHIREPFIPNDLEIGNEENTIEIITGPNMSGKSTFLRQNAIIVILAQIGSFVPAQSAVIPICDNIFSRIGSGDRLVQGESTFFVEMKETTNILRKLTSKSLIIMDEIGRGTSTYDGIALAWSLIEHLNEEGRKPKTLFATHYHELIVLSEKKGISHYHVTVKEEGEEIIFLKKVIKGMASKSYGIHVAKLAGMPFPVIQRAHEILHRLESKQPEKGVDQVSKNSSSSSNPKQSSIPTPIEKSLLEFDINTKTPLEAMQFLSELNRQLKDKPNKNSF